MHAGAGALPRGEQPGQAGAAVQIRADPAHPVVGRRGHRHGDAAPVEARRAHGRVDRGEALPQPNGPDPGRVQEHGPALLSVHDPGDRPGHDVTGSELGTRIVLRQEASALLIAHHRALPAHRLGDQEGAGSGERRGVELIELQVLERGPGPCGGGDPVARGDSRVRGVGEELAGAACRQQRRSRPHHASGPVGRHQLGADHPAVLDPQIHQCRLLAHCDPPLPDRRDQGVLDRPSGGVAAGVEDPRPGVGAFEAHRVAAVGPAGPVEGDSEVDQPADGRRPLLAQHAHRGLVAQSRARTQCVPGVGGGGVGGVERSGDAALGVTRRPLAELRLGHQQDVGGAGGTQRRRQPGDPGADHQQVGVHLVPGAHAQRSEVVVTGAGFAASMRSSARRAGWATSSPTVMRLMTSPASSDSSAQAR